MIRLLPAATLILAALTAAPACAYEPYQPGWGPGPAQVWHHRPAPPPRWGWQPPPPRWGWRAPPARWSGPPPSHGWGGPPRGDRGWDGPRYTRYEPRRHEDRQDRRRDDRRW